jgi:hypothetical protein
MTKRRKNDIRRTETNAIILHRADEVGVHLARSSSVSIVVHQFVGDNFVELIFDCLQK